MIRTNQTHQFSSFSRRNACENPKKFPAELERGEEGTAEEDRSTVIEKGSRLKAPTPHWKSELDMKKLTTRQHKITAVSILLALATRLDLDFINMAAGGFISLESALNLRCLSYSPVSMSKRGLGIYRMFA